MAETGHDPMLEALVNEHLKRMGIRMGELRALHGLSLTELEEHSGVDVSQLSKIEKGKKNISIRTAIRIADSLGVQLHELFVPPELSQILPKSKRKSNRKTGKKKAG